MPDFELHKLYWIFKNQFNLFWNHKD